MKPTYYISFNGTDYTQIYPSNEPKVSLLEEPGEIFKRWKVDSFKISKTLNSSIYATLLSYFFDPTKFLTDINFRIQDNGVTTFEFICPIQKGKINTETGVYEITPEPDDLYRDILNQYDKKWQMRTGGYMFDHADRFYYPKLNTNAFANSSFDTFVDSANDVVWENSLGGTQNAQSQLVENSSVGAIIPIIITDFTGDSFKLRLISIGTGAVSTDYTVTGNGLVELVQTINGAGNVYVEIEASVISSGTFSYMLYYQKIANEGGLLLDVITSALSGLFIGATGTVLSTILWNDPLPTNPPEGITYSAVNDYVLGTSAIWNYLWITRADTFTATKEDVVNVSLKDVMQLLKKLRLWWFIDDDGAFRIEHDKYFRNYNSQLDVTALTEKPEVDNLIYNYDSSNIYSQINYSENNEKNEDWIAYPVLFDPKKTSEKIQQLNFSDLSTDLSNMAEGTNTSSEGFVLFRTKYSGSNYYAIFGQGTITPTNYYLNTELSWAWLFKNYYDYFAEADSGTINNGTAITYDHVKEFLKQDNIKFHTTTILDWKRPVTLENGDGYLLGADYMPETGWINISVGFNPYI